MNSRWLSPFFRSGVVVLGGCRAANPVLGIIGDDINEDGKYEFSLMVITCEKDEPTISRNTPVLCNGTISLPVIVDSIVSTHESVRNHLKSREERAKEPPELQSILGLIDPAFDTLQEKEKGVVASGVEANVRWSVKNLIRLQSERKRGGDCSVVGAVYELKLGRVRFLDDSKTSKKAIRIRIGLVVWISAQDGG